MMKMLTIYNSKDIGFKLQTQKWWVRESLNTHTFVCYTQEVCPQNLVILRSQARSRSIKPGLDPIENRVSTVEPLRLSFLYRVKILKS